MYTTKAVTFYRYKLRLWVPQGVWHPDRSVDWPTIICEVTWTWNCWFVMDLLHIRTRTHAHAHIHIQTISTLDFLWKSYEFCAALQLLCWTAQSQRTVKQCIGLYVCECHLFGGVRVDLLLSYGHCHHGGVCETLGWTHFPEGWI
jgi:hypothetical protein